MIHQIKSLYDPYIKLLKDDPIRPTLPFNKRISDNATTLVLIEDNQPKAITCISLQDSIPDAEHNLFISNQRPKVAVFYTIWSYSRGSGRTLIFEAAEFIKKTFPNIVQFVTLSPKTEMAHKFHIGNGAIKLRENADTINYEYVQLKC